MTHELMITAGILVLFAVIYIVNSFNNPTDIAEGTEEHHGGFINDGIEDVAEIKFVSKVSKNAVEFSCLQEQYQIEIWKRYGLM